MCRTGQEENKTTASPDMPFLEKELILVAKELESGGQRVDSITVQVRNMRQATFVESFVMEKLHKYVWKLELRIPLHRLTEDLQYKFIAQVTTFYKLSFNLIHSQSKLESATHEMSDSTIEREVWNTFSIAPNELADHYGDIVVNCSKSLPLSECVMQIEDLSKKYPVDSKKAGQIYKLVSDLSDKTSKTHILLMTIVLGNVFKDISCAVEMLQTKEINKMFDTLQQFQLSDLTNASSQYMVNLVNRLCKKVHGDNHCFLTFVSETYPFFDEKQLSNQFQNIVVTRRNSLVPNRIDNTLERKFLHLFKRIYERSSSEDAQILLCQLLRNSPVALAAKAYIFVKSETQANESEEDKVVRKMLECVTDLLKSFLKSRKRAFEELFEMCELIKSCCDLMKPTKTDFENAFIFIIQSSSGEHMVRFRNIVLEVELFESLSQQSKLIECLAARRNLDLHLSIFEFLLDKKFEEFGKKCDFKWFDVCVENASVELKKEHNLQLQLKHLYAYISEAKKVPIINKSEELIERLNTAAVDVLKQNDLKMLLREAEVIKSFSEKSSNVGEQFRLHVQMLLLSRQRSNYYELLANFCGKRGELLISSRFTADIVCTILDLCNIGEEYTASEGFYKLVENYDVWTSIVKARGACAQDVRLSNSYKQAMKCVQSMLESFKTGDIRKDYLEHLTEKEGKAKIIMFLCLFTKSEKTVIEKQWNCTEMSFKAEITKISESCSVLNAVQSHMVGKPVQMNIKQLADKLYTLKINIEKGQLTVKQLQKSHIIWQELSDLPNTCKGLQKYVKSKIFWTSCKEIIKNIFENELLSETCEEEEPFESIHTLFEMQNKSEFSQSFRLLEILSREGIAAYKRAWECLNKDHDTDIRFVLHLITGVTIVDEINYAEQVLDEPIPYVVKTTLQRLKNINRYEETVDAVKKTIEVFKINLAETDEFFQAIHAFDAISDCKGESCLFSLVVTSLEKVDKISKELSNETVCILNALNESSILIDFLKQIVDEDIRNLIDAVEDISEQYVQESTVSALIDVKSFLHDVLVKSSQGTEAHSFLTLLNKQTQALSKNASKLPGKIHDCMSSLHNLKSLYGNVANRGEMTAEIIGNILTQGSFTFQLQQDGFSIFLATYENNAKPEQQKQASLMDLRSRALLLMNARSKAHNRKIKGEDLEKFVSFIDLSMEVTELIDDLHQSGNIDYMSFEKTINCQCLKSLREELAEINNKWSGILKSLRKKYYLLNFIHGPEIYMLYNFFEKNIGKEKVVTILRFIHPEIELNRLLEEYCSLKSKEKVWSNDKMLESIGNVLHFGHKGTTPIKRPFRFDASLKKMTDVVQSKKLFVAALGENSNQVVKTLLALYLNTTEVLPEPHQVLFCARDTTWNEIELLLYRCFGSFRFKTIPELFCIANIEMLANELQFKLVEDLKTRDTEENFLLALICRGSANHPFVHELSSFTSKTSLSLSDEQVRQAFQNECPEVVTYTSLVPGLGKTNEIKENSFLADKSLVTLHISGPLYKKTIIDKISSAHVGKQHALHIDIGSVDNPLELDTFIFELVILGYVTAGFNAVSLGTNLIFIEIANTINDSLRNSLNTAMHFQRKHLMWKNFENFRVSEEINSPIQVVCHYLQCQENGNLDKRDLRFTGSKPLSPLKTDICRRLLKNHFGTDSELSFAVVNLYLRVLADQLKKMSCSLFFRVSQVSDMVGHSTLSTVRSTLFTALDEASKEFSSRSIAACRSTQKSTAGISTDGSANEEQSKSNTKLIDIVKKRVEGMIRWEDSNHLIFVFHCQNIQTLSPLYRDVNSVPKHIKILFESQMKKQMQNFKQMSQCQLQTMLQNVARSNPQPLSQANLQTLNTEYALTPDNLLKMVLIMLRVKSHIPVVIMGETGCGKTSLIRYLATISGVDFYVLNIHAGIEEDEILEAICTNNDHALSRPETERWLFLDEINTSEFIGLISNAICSSSCLGRDLAPNLVVMGACNPYKLRTESAVSTAGLTEKVKSDELSKLVYRVLPLPERMVDYVWDFGSLSDEDEAVYIRRMIDDVLPGKSNLQELLKDLLSRSQIFVRRAEAVTYCVSLRDVQRCKMLIKWFLKKLPAKGCESDIELKSFILALSICYHSRFAKSEQRKLYRTELEKVFAANGKNSFTEKLIQDIIFEEQNDILKRMELPPGTARNAALQENVFVILVCLLNKIPVFLVGKPGCSKSLSMQVIRSNLRGKDSKNIFFKSLPQLYCVSFQGSESSTSDGIQKVFDKAIRYQQSNNEDEVLSVVILDEIGLAEVSRFNPLKVLHNLLEPDGRPQPDVAVVGISNWALDASKMNRAIHLSRPDMDQNELYQTGKSISESFSESKQQQTPKFFQPLYGNVHVSDLDGLLEDIAKSYLMYTEILQFRNFHGLRDYYSLVKYVSKRLLEDRDENTIPDEGEKEWILLQGLQRNFGGLPSESSTLLSMFKIKVNSDDLQAASVLKLMEDNIKDKMARHLMCITSGESILSVIENLLTEIGRDERVVIFGSHFEEDQTADYNYRILSRVILCMEQGFILILRDLETIYGSLYDMLNQNYTIIGKKKHCRIALGHYSNPICQVHDDFRCIVLVGEKKVDHSDPPFLNRFEKQYVKILDIINTDERSVFVRAEKYVKHFCMVESCHFDENFCFPLYSQDLIVSLAIQSCREVSGKDDIQSDQTLERCKRKLLYIVQPDAILRLRKSKCEEIQQNAEHIKESYFKLPIHSGIFHFIDEQLAKEDNKNRCLMTAVLTNSSIHTKHMQLVHKSQVQVDKLGAFKSEKQLSLRMQHFWSESKAKFLFLHCSATEDEQHISLAKTIIESSRSNALRENVDLTKHIYMILHLDRRNKERKLVLPVNYLSGWELVLLDSIEEPEIPLPQLCTMSLFDTVLKRKPLTKYLTEQLFWCFTRIRYQMHGRNIESIHKIIEQVKKSEDLLEMLEELICDSIDLEGNSVNEIEWQEKTAFDAYALNTSSSFMSALEQAVLSVIHIPLSKLVFRLENINALSSFFYDSSMERRDVWKKMVKDRTLFSITDTPAESGPECYSCTCADLTLQMPLSKIVYDEIEKTKDVFIDSFLYVKGKRGVTENDDMPPEVMEELFSQHETVVKDILPDLQSFMYDSLCDDYFHDFSNIVSYATISRIREDIRIQIVQWTLKERISLHTKCPIELFVKLHATLWIYSAALSAEHQLFETCADIFDVQENVSALMDHICPKVMQEKEGKFDDEIPKNDLSTKQILDIDKDDSLQSMSVARDTNDVADKDQSPNVSDNFMVSSLADGRCSQNQEYVEKQELQEEISDAIENEAPSEASAQTFSDTEFMEKSDGRAKLVEFISMKMLPTQACMKTFASLEDWNARVSIVLNLALQVSLEPRVFHSLRFVQDIVSILNVCTEDEKIKYILKLGDILHSDDAKRLDSEECFQCVTDMLFTDIKVSANKTQEIIAAYLNRCLAADTESRVMSYLLDLLEEGLIENNNLVVLKPPLHLALNLESEEIDDDDCEMYENIYSSLIHDKEVDLDEDSFICHLDKTLKSFKDTETADMSLSVLVVDILEEYFDTLLTEKTKQEEPHLDMVRSDLMSAQKLILSCDYGLQFLASISFYKSFAKYFGALLIETHFDIAKCSTFFPEIRAVMNREEQRSMSFSIRQFLLKTFGRGMLPWKFQKVCEDMHNTLEVFQCPDWTEEYFTSSIEGNPILLHVQLEFNHVCHALTEKDIEKQETCLRQLIKHQDWKMLLAIHGVVLSRFCIGRSYRQQDDTYNCLANTIKRIATDENMDKKNLDFLVCCLGIKDFAHPGLQLNAEEGEEDTIIAIFCCTLLATLLASNQMSRSQKLSLLAKCLLCPLKIERTIIASMRSLPIRGEKVPLSTEDHFENCLCGHRYVHRKPISSKVISCPVCSTETTEQVKTSENCTAKKQENKKDVFYEHHKFHSVTVKLIRLFVDACLFGSLALDFADKQIIKTVTELPVANDVPKILISHIKDSFTDLQEQMGMGYRDLYVLLQACLQNVRDLICEDKVSVENPKQMVEWCLRFENQTTDLIADRFKTVINVVREQSKVAGLPDDAAELCVNENDTISLSLKQKTQFYPSLFRIQGRPSLLNMTFELDMLLKKNVQQYPFLVFVLKTLPHLTLTKHILPLVQWHLMTVTYIGYRFKRYDCQEMSIQDFLFHDDDEKVRDILKTRFENLQKSFDDLKDVQQALKTPIKRLDFQTKMKECLLLDQHSIIYRLMKELVDVHNEFLDSALQISAQNKCQALKCLSRGWHTAAIPCRTVSEVTLSSVVSYEWDEELLNYSHADLTYGCGHQLIYEFEAIEKSLALDLVCGKIYILFENTLPSVVFVDEFYQGFAKMVTEISNIIPQKALPSDIVNEIKAKRDKHPRLTSELITHVGVLIALAKKTKGEPGLPVIEFVERWKNYLTRPLSVDLLPAPEDSVKLCHLISLYGLLEELNADSLVDSLSDRYREPLRTIEMQLNELINSKQVMADIILKATKRYVYRCVSAGDVEPSRALSDCLADDSFWPFDSSEQREAPAEDERRNLKSLIPESLKVKHLHQMITLMKRKLKELTDKEVKLTGIAKIKPPTTLTKTERKTERKKKLAQKRKI